MPRKNFDHGEFTKALIAASLTGWLDDARTVYLAMDDDRQRAVVNACSGLAGLAGVGHTTAFEIMVATARLKKRAQ